MPELQGGPANAPFLGESKLRDGMTNREREVVALERISDQLALLCSIVSQRFSTTTTPGDKNKNLYKAAVGSWENEGGSLMPDRNLPFGMTAKVVTHYTVGPYIYSDFDLAFDELQRQRAAMEIVLR